MPVTLLILLPTNTVSALNLNKPEGLEIARKLVSWADIVADSHRPGVMERWKLSL